MDNDVDRPCRVLFVEDDETLLGLTAEAMEGAGYEVLGTRSCAAAWQLIESGLPFDLLVADVRTPGTLDGIGLVACLREMGSPVPTILISGSPVAQGSGASLCLTKPVSPSVLIDALNSLRPPPTSPSGTG